MAKIIRKPISKKDRFEIFKRDNFQCAYCGKTPPEVTLEIDHIEPLSKGGADDKTNFITACFDCNRGKKDIPLNKIPPSIAQNTEVLKEKELQISEYRKFIKKIHRRENKDIQDISNIYSSVFTKYELSENFKSHSLKKFLGILPKHEVEDAMHKAISYIQDPDNSIKYFCGICWNKIKAEKRGHDEDLDKELQIKELWKKISKEVGKGSGYCNQQDIKLISGTSLDELEMVMRIIFKTRHQSYWKAFVKRVMET